MVRQPPDLGKVVDTHGYAAHTERVRELYGFCVAEERRERDAAREAEGKSERSYIFASELGQQCDRRMVYALSNTPISDPVTLDGYMNMGAGEAIEAYDVDLLKRHANKLYPGAKVYEQVWFSIPCGDTSINGRLDVVVVIPELENLLLEIKSTTSYAVKAMYEKGEKGQLTHRYQALAYLHASHEGLLVTDAGEVLPPFDVAYLVYRVKDAKKGSPPVHPFEVRYDRAQMAAALARGARWWRQAQAGEIPLRPAGYKWDKFPCGWCSWRGAPGKGGCWDQ